jgi:molecular chaperone HscB
MQATSTKERTCWRCRADAAGAVVCPRCEAVLPVAPDTDLFTVLGLPRGLELDAADLERRYHAASRAVHPDRHQTAGAAERELSLAASAAVNRAYRTLRDPVARGRYWLELHGVRPGQRGPSVPAAIAADVFETQEKLEELRSAPAGPQATALRGDVEALRASLAQRLDGLRDDLVACFPGWNDGRGLEDLDRRLAEIAYLRTLLGDVEDALGEGLRGTHHRH